MIPPFVVSLAMQYGSKILIGLLAITAIVGGYFYIKHTGAIEERDSWLARDAEVIRQSEDLIKLKTHEADQINQQNQERANNAIKTYANHYDELRAAASRIPERVYVTTKTNCSSDTMPGTGGSRPQAAGGIGGTGKAELSPGTLRRFDEVIESGIVAMQLRCERVLNTVE